MHELLVVLQRQREVSVTVFVPTRPAGQYGRERQLLGIAVERAVVVEARHHRPRLLEAIQAFKDGRIAQRRASLLRRIRQ